MIRLAGTSTRPSISAALESKCALVRDSPFAAAARSSSRQPVQGTPDACAKAHRWPRRHVSRWSWPRSDAPQDRGSPARDGSRPGRLVVLAVALSIALIILAVGRLSFSLCSPSGWAAL